MGLILGVLFGLLELIPNAHPAILAITLLPVLGMGYADNLMFVTALLITSMSLNTLTHTYHPIPKAMLHAAEPAQRMAYEGQGKWATEIQLRAIPWGIAAALIFTPVLVHFVKTIKAWVIPIGILLLVLSISRSKNKPAAAFVLVLAVTVGILAQEKLEMHAMMPLLAGLFTIPPLLHILVQEKTMALPKDQSKRPPKTPTEYSTIDSTLGIVGAFMPGISTSSMVHLRVNEVDIPPHEYLTRSTLQKSTSDITALFVLILLHQAHSVLSVAMMQTAIDFPLHYSFALVAGCLLVLFPIVQWLTLKAENPYITVIQKLPQKLFAIVLAPVTIGIVLNHAGMYGLIIMAAAAGVSLLQKHFRVPNQILLQGMTIPVLLMFM